MAFFWIVFFSTVLTFFLSLGLVPVFSHIFFKLRLLDVPDGKLKKHKVAVPYSGGPSIFVSIFATQLALSFLGLSSLKFFAFTAPLFALGFLDDIFGLSQKIKFVIQAFFVCAALIFFKAKFIFFALFWALSVVNAFNLVDIADGLCATIALCSSAGFLVVSIFSGFASWALVFASVFGGLAGFLVFNYPPARSYLGDSGSTFLGALFGLASALMPWRATLNGFVISLLILGLALSEVFFLCLIRLYLGIAPYRGSPHHFYIFLKNKGWSPKKILSLVACVGCELSLVGFGVHAHWLDKIFLAPFGAFALLIWIIVVYL